MRGLRSLCGFVRNAWHRRTLSTLAGVKPANFKDVIRSGVKRVQCDICGYTFYENPKVIAGMIATWQAEPSVEPLYLLGLRSIAPRKGFWSPPGGFTEMFESIAGGAAREAYEESGAVATPGRLLAVYNILPIGQVVMYYEGILTSPSVEARQETLDTKLFRWSDIPWEDLAFPANSWALLHHRLYREREALKQLVAANQVTDANLLQRFLKHPEPPYDIPRLKGFENSLNIWYHPERGLYHSDAWLTKPAKQATRLKL